MKKIQRKKIFFDTEFTGLHKDTTLISIGLITDAGETFYAELNDYDKTQVDKWVEQNVESNLKYGSPPEGEEEYWTWDKNKDVRMRGNKQEVARYLADWFQVLFGGPMSWVDYTGYPQSTTIKEPLIEMWGDCLSYDWVLFNDLWGSAFDIPKCVYTIPFDVSTYLKLEGFDPDITREDFIDISVTEPKHNALHDAKVIKACYEKLSENNKNLNKIYNQTVRME